MQSSSWAKASSSFHFGSDDECLLAGLPVLEKYVCDFRMPATPAKNEHPGGLVFFGGTKPAIPRLLWRTKPIEPLISDKEIPDRAGLRPTHLSPSLAPKRGSQHQVHSGKAVAPRCPQLHLTSAGRIGIPQFFTFS
jgi:hypothetical protein